MANTFRVAILGSHKAEYYFAYGVQVFDLAVDQICNILEKPGDALNGVNTADLGIQPVTTYSVMTGGRSYPMVSREELATCMQGVDILIAIVPSQLTWLHFTSSDFFNCLMSENLIDKCKFAVARIIDNETKNGGSRSGRRSANDKKPESILKTCGLDISVLKTRLVVIADDSLRKKVKSKKGEKKNLKADIASLRSELNGEEVKRAVVEPVKETLSAGKTLINAGQRFGRWITSLVKSQ